MSRSAPRPSTAAHPRSRGENAGTASRRESRAGSSPLTRGKPRRRTQPRHGNRLIPAHAGKTRGLPRKWSRFAAHPRSRGENLRYIDRKLTRPGSSPLTRGKLAGAFDSLTGTRLIPAHAGKTWYHWYQVGLFRAHPRSRGENALASERDCASCGSSPLTRGKQRRHLQTLTTIGLIPAHAGKTCSGTFLSTRPRAHPRSRGENVHARDVKAA